MQSQDAKKPKQSALRRLPLSALKQDSVNSPVEIHPLKQLQSRIGNHAVGQLIQAKLRVSQPDDMYEQEADEEKGAMQRKAANERERADSSSTPANARIQTQLEVSKPEDDEETEAERVADEVAEMSEIITFAGPDDGEGATPPIASGDETTTPSVIQRTAANGSGAEAGADLQARLHTRLGKGMPLPPETLRHMESAIGASFREVRVHTDDHAADINRSLHANAFTYGRDIFFGAGKFDPASAAGKHVLAHELTHVVQQRGAAGQTIQRQKPQTPKLVEIHFIVTVHEQISGAEFYVRSVMQYKRVGRAEAEQLIRDKKVNCSHSACSTGVTPDLVGKPISVVVQTAGFSKGEKKAQAHRNAQIAALPAAEKKALNAEADRRFWRSTEYKRGQSLGKDPKEEGMRQFWLRTREGVLQDQENIAKLPPKIKEFLNPGSKRKIPPEDYAIVLRLAKKLESFSESDWLLYQRRVNASTDDYELVERSIERFQAQQAAEAKTMDRIRGTESLYQQVRSFKDLERFMYTPSLKTDALPLSQPGNLERLESERASVNAALAAANFANIQEFDAACADFIKLFRRRAVEITLLALRESEKIVLAERMRYEKPEENAQLFDKLAPTRAALGEASKAASEARPTVMQLKTETWNQTPQQKEATARYIESHKRAADERKKHEDTNPILKDPKLSSYALEAEDADTLGRRLRRNADDRLADILKTRVNVLDKQDFVFKLDNIIALTRQELGVTPGSIYDLSLKDYQKDIQFGEILIAIATGALAIGLGLLSFGTGTVAVLAGSAGLALSVYQAGEELEKYSAAQAAAHTAFDKALSVSSEEPSLVWVAIALIGVGFDGAALASAFKAAAPAARLLSQTGNLSEFDEALKVAQLSEAVKKNLSRAAQVEKEYQAAAEELGKAFRESLGRMYMGGLDPDIIAKATKAAYYAAKKGITSFEVFLRQLRLQKFAKSIDFNSLGPKEIEALEKAFKAGADQVSAEAAKTTFSIKIPYKSGERMLTLDDSGKLLLDGKPLAATKYEEVYKQLGLTHAYKGHGPSKNLADVAQEALTNKPSFASGKFSSERAFLESFEEAKAKFIAQGGKELKVEIEVTPDVGRAFMRNDKVPKGVTPMLPFDAPPGVSEIPVTHVRAIFQPDGSLVSIYPIGL
jgi:Domain of unknown function (DUF4157)